MHASTYDHGHIFGEHEYFYFGGGAKNEKNFRKAAFDPSIAKFVRRISSNGQVL